MPRALVVDDDPHIRELVALYLKDEGFDIVEKTNGADALAYAENHAVDLAVIDIMMPQMDGWELCSKLREFGDMPIIMITAKGEAQDRIHGFKLGTDDYLVKPFDPVELVLRVKALLKRYRISVSNIITLGHLSLDRSRYLVVYADGQIWGLDYEGDERTVDVHIKRLRERFPEAESGFRIVTIRGLGYRLEVTAQ